MNVSFLGYFKRFLLISKELVKGSEISQPGATREKISKVLGPMVRLHHS